MSIQGAPQRRPLPFPAAGAKRSSQSIDERRLLLIAFINALLLIVLSTQVVCEPIARLIAEQIAPVFGVRFGRDGVAGVFRAPAPHLNDRLEGIFDWYDLKAGRGRKGWLGLPGKSPNHLVTRQYDVARTLYDAPTVIRLLAQVGIELRQRFELSTAQLIGTGRNGCEKDPKSQKWGTRIAHGCGRLTCRANV